MLRYFSPPPHGLWKIIPFHGFHTLQLAKALLVKEQEFDILKAKSDALSHKRFELEELAHELGVAEQQ
jgi:hypothetical protein